MIALGDFTIDRVVEYEGPFVPPEDLILNYDQAVYRRHRDWMGPLLDSVTGALRISLHSFVLRTGRHTILIDTCMGNHKERPARPLGHHRTGNFPQCLTAQGVHPEEVDFVMCTHLHWDHVGWNTQLVDGQWVPTFPNARYIISQREYDHMDAMHARGSRTLHDRAFEDSILPLMRAERAQLVADGFHLEDGVWLESYPGHTPGNIVINIASHASRGVFSSDLFHTPLQIACPAWSSTACYDPEQAYASRCRFIEQHADTDHLVMPAHFLAPSAGHIVSHGDGVAFKFLA
jgi:glyoxylase-like metal-dependent hydrolase (beta-lactamase superfamily II)